LCPLTRGPPAHPAGAASPLRSAARPPQDRTGPRERQSADRPASGGHSGPGCRVAPSAQLRTWYAHDPARFEEFSRRYRAELTSGAQREALALLLALAVDGRSVTLLTAARVVAGSEAAVLAELINGGS